MGKRQLIGVVIALTSTALLALVVLIAKTSNPNSNDMREAFISDAKATMDRNEARRKTEEAAYQSERQSKRIFDGSHLTSATIGCVSEELWREHLGYMRTGDQYGKTQLLSSGRCLLLSKGETVSVISPGVMIATIRYQGVKLFTMSEAVRSE
jgi:hypothetical protein